jgi:hypothetical protein
MTISVRKAPMRRAEKRAEKSATPQPKAAEIPRRISKGIAIVGVLAPVLKPDFSLKMYHRALSPWQHRLRRVVRARGERCVAPAAPGIRRRCTRGPAGCLPGAAAGTFSFEKLPCRSFPLRDLEPQVGHDFLQIFPDFALSRRIAQQVGRVICRD